MERHWHVDAKSFMIFRGIATSFTCRRDGRIRLSKVVKEYLSIPDGHILFAGIAVGYEDSTAPVNQLKTDRAPLSDFVTFHSPKGKL
jgi:hypothetical protein